MNGKIDREYGNIIKISSLLREEYAKENEEWLNSPFEWIKHKPSRTIGAIGEKIIASWLAMHDFEIRRSPDSEADRIVENKRVEIKFSTLWKNGYYVFQQIRDQNYDLIVLFGVSPHDAHCWVIPKQEIVALWSKHAITGQHTGAEAEDTAWIHLLPDNSIEDFSRFGNSLTAALKRISSLTGYYPESLSDEFED